MRLATTITDQFSYLVMVAPDFPPEDRTDLTSEFVALLQRLDELAREYGDPALVKELDRIKEVTRRAYDRLRLEDEANGRATLKTAVQLYATTLAAWRTRSSATHAKGR